MPGSLTDLIPWIIIGLVLLVLAVWLIRRTGQSTTVVGDESARTDVLDEGAAPAQRNQALIDAPPARAVDDMPARAVDDRPAAVEDTPATLATPTPEPAPVPAPPLAKEPATAPVSKAIEDTPAPPPASDAGAAASADDDLRQIKGVGPKLATLLRAEGITSFAQIAAWTEADIAAIDAKLDRFAGRIERDQWVEQAKLLILGDNDEFSAKFGSKG